MTGLIIGDRSPINLIRHKRGLIVRLYVILATSFISIIFSCSLYAEADKVKLTYGWKKGMVANVHMDSERIRRKGTASVTSRIKETYTIKTEAHKSGILINFSNAKVKVTQSGASGNQEKIQQFISKISALSPSYVIDKEGVLVDVENLDKMKKVIDDEFAKMFSDAPKEVQSKMRPLMAALTSKPQLMAQLSSEWNRDVGQWIGGELESGFVYELEFSTQMPMFGNTAIPSKGKYEYKGKVPCDAGKKDSNCVLLSYVSSIDKKAFRPVMEEFFKKIGAEMPEGYSPQVDLRVELVTEPTTLIPHSVKSEKIIKTSMIANQPGVERIERVNYVYEYFDKGDKKGKGEVKK